MTVDGPETIVVGLDGAGFDMLGPLVAAGELPTIGRIGSLWRLILGAAFVVIVWAFPRGIYGALKDLVNWLARAVVRVEHIGMVNILAEDRIVPEFVQNEATPARVLSAALPLIEDTPERRRMLDDLARVRERLGGGGASDRAAREVLAVAEGGGHG